MDLWAETSLRLKGMLFLLGCTRGKRYIDDPRNQLYKECVHVVREALPRSFCFENVPDESTFGGMSRIKNHTASRSIRHVGTHKNLLTLTPIKTEGESPMRQGVDSLLSVILRDCRLGMGGGATTSAV
jgi:hypothetical protein